MRTKQSGRIVDRDERMRLRSRRFVIGATAVAVLVIGALAGCAALAAPEEDSPAVALSGRTEGATTTVESSASPTPTATPSPILSVREETATEVVTFTETTQEDASLPAGQTQIVTPGQHGERTLTFRVQLTDGVETSRELLADVVTREPVTQVTHIGTSVAPPPAAPDNACDPNYADACVPVASDVDCAGGQGNGPAYFDGVARVVGSDVYDLDRDGDGYACEP